MSNNRYHYHVEDGQFSFDIKSDKLLGIEGNVIKLSPYREEESEIDCYILFIDGHYVECLGSVERNFPKTPHEHQELKELMLKTYEDK
ncbi:MAG TPA: hypothetical protein VNW99_06675 [Cytophagaceae bacterium]|jgi:hypothetical protein|nr:hypothetical protein [Cytophagaceae bacterium]